MAFQEVQALNAKKYITLGGTDKKSGEVYPSEIEGYFLGTKEKEGMYGQAFTHFFKTKFGVIGVNGKTQLNQKLEMVKPGVRTRVIYEGLHKQGVKSFHNYSVAFDTEDTIPVASLNPSVLRKNGSASKMTEETIGDEDCPF